MTRSKVILHIGCLAAILSQPSVSAAVRERRVGRVRQAARAVVQEAFGRRAHERNFSAGVESNSSSHSGRPISRNIQHFGLWNAEKVWMIGVPFASAMMSE